MKAKRRLSDFDFTAKGSHVALVDRGANGQTILVTKSFSDKQKWDAASQKYVPMVESGLRVNLSLEDALMMVRDLYPENIECLTNAITKSANGAELVANLEKAEAVPADFAARKERLKSIWERLDKAALEALASFAPLIKPQVEKSEMTTSTTPVPAEVQKLLDASAAETAALKAELAKNADALAKSETARVALAADTAILKAAHDRAETAAFVTKATALKSCGFPKDATPETVGAAMQKLAKADAAAYAVVEAILVTAADTISKAAKLEERGVEGQPDVIRTNSEALTKKADEIRKANPKLTPEQAVAEALEKNPELYGA